MMTLGLVFFIITLIGTIVFALSIIFDESAFSDKVQKVSFDFVCIGSVISVNILLVALLK